MTENERNRSRESSVEIKKITRIIVFSRVSRATRIRRAQRGNSRCLMGYNNVIISLRFPITEPNNVSKNVMPLCTRIDGNNRIGHGII